MDKRLYERFKTLTKKEANGTATFAERNWLNMQKKLMKRIKLLKQQSEQLSKGVNGPRA